MTTNSNGKATVTQEQNLGPSFLSRLLEHLPEVLETNCPGGVTISAEKVAEKLGAPIPAAQDLIVALIKSGNAPGWEVKKGAFGGIGRSGVRVERGDKQHNRTVRVVELIPRADFCAAVQKIVAQLLPENDTDRALKPWEIANHLPAYGFQPGSPSEKAVSIAVRYGKIPGFLAQSGLKAGVRRVRPGETPQYLEEEKEEKDAKNGSRMPTPAAVLASPFVEKLLPAAKAANTQQEKNATA